MRALCLGILLSAAGCGPVEYLSQVTQKAAMAVEEAKAADAERYAPYEWYAATQYIRKARTEASVADFEAAIEFGRKAEILARKARQLSLERAAGGGDSGAPTIEDAAAPEPSYP